MTKFLVVSDLHNEFVRQEILAGTDKFAPVAPDGSYDAVILGGDIDLGTTGVTWAASYFRDMPIVMIAGNHEFYGGRTMDAHYKALKEAADGVGIHFLERDTITIKGVKIAGCTLWTDALGLLPGVEQRLNDFRQIKIEQGRYLTLEYWREYHEKSLDWLKYQRDADIIVTHHAPSFQSTDWSRYNNRLLDPLFASGLDHVVADMPAKLWIHGHMHTSQDYTIGSTRVLANPRGYVPDMMNPGWNPNLIVDIASEDAGSNPVEGSKYSEPQRKGWWNHRTGGSPQDKPDVEIFYGFGD